MALNPDSALDNLTRMVQVIEGDRKLHDWFCTLAQTPTVTRRNKIYAMVQRMRAEGTDTDLVASFRLLADSRVFDAACEALRGSHKNAA
jgi:hypothetical protein